MYLVEEEGKRPIRVWAQEVEPEAMQQLHNLAALPFVHPHGVACMPDVHVGKGATIGAVIATERAIIPAAVGVDIGCGMNAVRLSLHANDLPDTLCAIRDAIEKVVPLGTGGAHQHAVSLPVDEQLTRTVIDPLFGGKVDKFLQKAGRQVGTLGAGNHFIELCLDEQQQLWVMLHSGSRGVGNLIGRHYIARAKRTMERLSISLPDSDLAYLSEGEDEFDLYLGAVEWAQNYARDNRRVMMERIIAALRQKLSRPFQASAVAVNCHHNYVQRETHFGQSLWVTRKGAIHAGAGELGIIPGSMGQRSYIVRGRGNPASYCSCSHGAGRLMSRGQAKKRFTVDDLVAQTAGIECRKDAAVLDEIPAAYKDIDQVMAQQRDLVDVVYTLRQIVCVKGG